MKNGEKNSKASSSQGCDANTLEDGDLLVSDIVISSNNGKKLQDKYGGFKCSLAHDFRSTLVLHL